MPERPPSAILGKGLDRDTVQHYISVVAHKILIMTKQVYELSQRNYRSSGPLALSEILVRILSRFFDELLSLLKKVKQQPPEDIILIVYTINYITVTIIPELIEAIEMANINSPIASVIEAYENIGNQIQYGTQTIIHPNWEYNASENEIMGVLKTMTGSLGKEDSKAIFSGAPPYLVIITYPKVEELIILRQALIAHEVGHFIDRVEGWTKFLAEKQLLTPEDSDTLTALAKELETQEGRKFDTEGIQIFIGEMLGFWLQEIVADYLAISILGPAYLFAFDEICFSPQNVSPKKLSLTHPPDQLRKAIMGELIRKKYLNPIHASKEYKSFTGTENLILGRISEWVETISAVNHIKYKSIVDHPELPDEMVASIYVTLRRTIMSAVSMLSEHKLPKIEAEEWFCSRSDIVDAIKLQTLLSEGLTPTELYSNPARDPSFAAIMNSGWFHFLWSRNVSMI